jgi:hypothetical protein
LKLSKKSPSGVSSVEIAGIPQRNKPSVPTSWASNAFVTELARLFRQFLDGVLRSSAKGLLRSSLSDRLTSPPLGVVVAAPMRMVRFFDILNTPIAVLGLSIVVVVVNVFVYFDYYSKTPTPLPTERTAPSATTLERTERAGPKEKTLPEVTRTERTRPSTTLQSTTPTAQSATVSATVSATSSPSP